MKELIRKIFLYLLLLIVVNLLIMVMVALSTNYTSMIERGVYKIRNAHGATFWRATDVGQWIQGKDKKALILGSSTAYRNLDPFVLDSLTNYSWFNMGSSSQTPALSLKLLREICKQGKVDLVLFDYYHGLQAEDDYESTFDWIKNSDWSMQQKWDLISKGTLDIKILQQLLYRSLKKTINGKNYILDERASGLYKGKGFVCSDKSKALAKEFRVHKMEEIQFDKSVKEIVEFCHEMKIPIVIHIAAELETQYELKGFPSDLALLDGQDFGRAINHYQFFYDTHHMTCEGSGVYSAHLAERIRKM